MEINTIHLFGIRIDEPIVTLTDLLVSVLCLIYFIRLHRQVRQNRSIVLFKFYFLTMSIATFLGGVLGHAFLYTLSLPYKLPGWIVSMFSIMLIERAVINHTRLLLKPRIIQILQIVNLAELATFMILSIYFLDFFFVEFHSGYGLMFVVLGLEGYLFFKTKNNASKNILVGIALAAIAALVFMNKLSPHQWFNHIAVSHVFMAFAAYFFYKGASKIEITSEASI